MVSAKDLKQQGSGTETPGPHYGDTVGFLGMSATSSYLLMKFRYSEVLGHKILYPRVNASYVLSAPR